MTINDRRLRADGGQLIIDVWQLTNFGWRLILTVHD